MKKKGKNSVEREDKTRCRLEFTLSNNFTAGLDGLEPNGFSKFVVPSIKNFRLLVPNSLVSRNARPEDGYPSFIPNDGIPVLTKLVLSGRYDVSSYHDDFGLFDFEVNGYESPHNLNHYTQVFNPTDNEYFKNTYLNYSLPYDDYLKTMKIHSVDFDGKQLDLRFFWITGTIVVPDELLIQLTKLVRSYPPSAIKLGCATKEFDSSGSYSETISDNGYVLKNEVPFHFDESSFGVWIESNNNAQPLSLGHYESNKHFQDFTRPTLDQFFGLKKETGKSSTDSELVTRIESQSEQIQKLSGQIASIAETLSWYRGGLFILVCVIIYLIASG